MTIKKILSGILATLFVCMATAQQPAKKYEKEWKKIDSLISDKQLTESALTEVNKLYTLAKKEKNEAQVIRTLLYKRVLLVIKEEDPEIKNIQLLEKEIESAGEPARSILQNILAEDYWRYFIRNRWKLYNRTETGGYKKEDIKTWGIEDFHKKISALFLASIKNERLLQQTKLEPFDPIIIKGNVRYLRPTLFDLLAHAALDYFKNGERTINQPAYAFEIDDPAAFSDAGNFSTHTFTTRDSSSLHFKALQLYQRLVQFHINDEKPDALVDVDIERLEFMNNNGIMETKAELFKQALENITNRYNDLPAAAQAWYLLANWYVNKGQEYNPLKGDSNRYELVRAKEICDRVIAQQSESEGKTNCLRLVHTITTPELLLRTEKVNIPGQPFRSLVTYKNVPQAYFRLVKTDHRTMESLGNNYWDDDYWKKLLQLPVLKTFSQMLPATNDYRQHQVEIKIDALEPGYYALVSGNNDEFSFDNNPMGVQFFYVSNIAYINKVNEYYVVHRETGQPMVRANVQVWYRYYDNATRKYQQRRGENIYTDGNGYFKIYPARTNNESNYRIQISTAGDELFLGDYSYSYHLPPNRTVQERERKTTFMFTDRSIYRPGQTVFIKGIVVSRRPGANETSIVTGLSTQVVLYDVNRQKVDSFTITTNEFGSWSGKFTLPANLVNGQFSITDMATNSQEFFSVEEYKRPTFVTEINKPAGTYRLNDSIEITGTAKAYAGNAVDGASVKYRVVRRTIIPMWYYNYRSMIWPPYQREEMEIAHGETTTGADGEFHVSFKAIPDKSIPKESQPTFYYEVSADITDIAGETRSGNTTVAVAYQALQLDIDAPERMHIDSLKNLKITSTNLAGSFEKTQVTLSIYKLKTPDRLFRDRYWQQPDQFVMTQEEYYRLFPYDIYKDENEVSKWPKIGKVIEVTDSTALNSNFEIRNTKVSPGWYVLEAITRDKYGEEVKDIQYIQLYNNKKEADNPLATGIVEAGKTRLEPGEKATYTIRTNLDSIYVVHEVIKKDDKETRSIVTLNKDSKSFDIPVTEQDRGGFGVYMAFVKHNRVYTDNQLFAVPYTNKELNISYATFRDKTLPGSEETWKVTISGHKSEKVAAEYLTAMYDASLDQFTPHSWQTPSLWDYFNQKNNWNGNACFNTVQSREKYNNYEASYFEKEYDELGLDQEYNGRIISIRGQQHDMNGDVRMAAPAPKGIRGEVALEENMVVDRNQSFKLTTVTPGVDANQEDDRIQKPVQDEQAAIQIRKNFNETAFFFPDLKTDSSGAISFSFTMPEAVTQWKWMSLAHTKDLAFGYSEKSIVTQKELMVRPNAPRFLREGDRMDFSTRIINLSDKEITGQVQLEFFDPVTNTSVDGWFRNMFPNQYFTVAAGQSFPVSFTIEIPYQYNKPVTYRVTARAGQLSDGEEAMLPVVSNRMLVTESMPLPVRGKAEKAFTFTKLLNSGNSPTLNHHALTVEFTSNPAWYAVQALPYLMEYPYECAEQVFNRYYANALAATIANASPKIKEIFERWKASPDGEGSEGALLSNLQKNEELKSVLLQETPWVLQAKSESQQKRNIALLFDMVRMSRELASSLNKLQTLQTANGGFVWFKGGVDDRYITQYILTGIGHLKKLGALPANDTKLAAMIRKAIPYLDQRIKEDYEELLKRNKQKEPQKGKLDMIHIQFLYMRSFFPDYPVPGSVLKAYTYYRKQSQQLWQQQNRYMQGMIALSLHRTGDVKTATGIVAALEQNALHNEEMGMYWKELNGGYYWYQSPIEAQSLLIETFTEVKKDTKAVDEMKTWLLKQKQTQHWRTTRATADACYALLLQGTEWLTNTPEVTIQLGDYTINSKQQQEEAGTGYFKQVIDGTHVKPAMGDIRVFIKSQTDQTTGRPAWGAVYWQYFENLDNITTAVTPLQLNKKLFIEKNTDRGPVLEPVSQGDALHVGDKVKVRIELRSDRMLEYVHMKDMRAACMEPVNVLSQYKWQGGLGYYETTKDASTNFFFGRIPKGTYVFEYSLFVTHTGTFSNGVTSIQCMYAPEFTSHSEGIKVNVE